MRELLHQWAGTRRQILGVVLVIVILYVLGSVAGMALHLYSLTQDRIALERSNEQLVRRIEELEDQIRYMQTRGYIESEAHGTLMWVYPGEKLIIKIGETPAQAPLVTPTPARR